MVINFIFETGKLNITGDQYLFPENGSQKIMVDPLSKSLY